MATINLAPDPDAELTQTPPVRRVQFDDGCLKIMPDSIRIPRQWRAVFSNLTKETLNNFVTQLRETRGCIPVTWQSPEDSFPNKYLVREWRTTALAGKVYSVSVSLEEWFG